MANRYSKTGFTARELNTLRSARNDIDKIIINRANKNDNPRALIQLNAASTKISMAIQLSNEWKK